ncbi:MAG: exodeoxyribonuclease VII large subunit [Actinomycetota bacterium]|nr:exodeoxyribonuclease VII large subunit [Actinomycetota bacterium]
MRRPADDPAPLPLAFWAEGAEQRSSSRSVAAGLAGRTSDASRIDGSEIDGSEIDGPVGAGAAAGGGARAATGSAAGDPAEGWADPAADPTEADGGRGGVLSVAAVLGEVRAAVAARFPAGRRVWVRGEIHKIVESQRGHCYVDLVDPDATGSDAPTLKVNVWRSTWGPLRALLADQGLHLQAGTVVVLGGRVELYAPRAQITFVADALDVDALLGRLAAERAALVARLQAEGLLDRAKGLVVPEVPLRVGLVASPRTEGCNDFLGQLAESGFAFHVLLAPVTVQGADAPAAIAAAVTALGPAGCDLVVVVRGGGSRADLMAFEAEAVARAIATCPAPVWTGIGHTGDQSVADLVAHTAWRTPTACGQALADRVASWWTAVADRATVVGRCAAAVVDSEAARHREQRHRLAVGAQGQLNRRADALYGRADRLAAEATRAVGLARLQLAQQSARLAPGAVAAVARQADRVASWRRLVTAYDVERQLERGYTLTVDDAGFLVRSADAARQAGGLTTRFVDGTVHSVVDRAQESAGGGAGR